MTAKMKILISDAGGNICPAVLPTDVTLNRLLPALTVEMQIPGADNIQYDFQHKQSGKKLQLSDTLLSAGVKEGDTLRLLPTVTAGGVSGGFISLFGEAFTVPPTEIYRCEIGPHAVLSDKVEQNDVTGRPLCPEHNTVMTLERRHNK